MLDIAIAVQKPSVLQYIALLDPRALQVTWLHPSET